MANTSRPFGFRPARLSDSSPWNGQSILYFHSGSDANDTYVGDLVTIDATNRSSGVADVYVPGIPAVTPVKAALTTSKFRGVVVGFIPAPEFNMTATASLGTMYMAASTAGYVHVVDDIGVVFESEEVGNSYTSASNNGINKVVDVTYTAGSKTTGIGNTQIDATTVSTAAVKPWRILRYTQRVDNFNFTSSDTNSRAKLDVVMNSSDLFPASQQGA